MSRTNHHRRNYKRWNIEEPYFNYLRFRNPETWETEFHKVGMETWDLRFYAGCRRRPQVIHRVLDFGTAYPWRFHHGTGGTARICADIAEGRFRADTRRYTGLARAVWNAGGELDGLDEPARRPRSIEWDLW